MVETKRDDSTQQKPLEQTLQEVGEQVETVDIVDKVEQTKEAEMVTVVVQRVGFAELGEMEGVEMGRFAMDGGRSLVDVIEAVCSSTFRGLFFGWFCWLGL